MDSHSFFWRLSSYRNTVFLIIERAAFCLFFMLVKTTETVYYVLEAVLNTFYVLSSSVSFNPHACSLRVGTSQCL